jgi:hypothetical protein
MFTLRRTTHITSLIATVATIYAFFYTQVDREITFVFLLLFLMSAFNSAEIESR